MRQKNKDSLFELLMKHQSSSPKDCRYYKIFSKKHKKEMKFLKLSTDKWNDILMYESLLKSRVQQGMMINVLEQEFSFFKSHGMDLPLIQKNKYILKSLDNLRSAFTSIEVEGIQCYCPHLRKDVNHLFLVDPANYQFEKYATRMRSPINNESLVNNLDIQIWLPFISSISLLRSNENAAIFFHESASILIFVSGETFTILNVENKMNKEELKKAILIEETDEDVCFRMLENASFINNKVRRKYIKKNRGIKNEV